ncbi:MAG: RICIN domain-containing protein [Acidobacteriota bacterium]
MQNVRVSNLVNRTGLFAGLALLAAILAGGGPSQALAQDSGDRAIGQAQRAVRAQIISQERVRGQTVLFNNDASSEFKSNTEVRVRGTGTVSNNNETRNNDARNNNGRSRNFSYEAIVNNRYRNNANNVTGIRYDWSGGWSDNRRDNDRDGRDSNGDNRAQSIYCASDDGRRHNCPVNTNGATVRLVNQRTGSNCVQGRTWGFNNTGIWVDRGCRADFEVSGGRGYGGRDNNSGNGNATRPNGRVSYSGPIMNRHSDKALDVTEKGMQDGANIQQWGYADQPNQNWDVIDLGNNEVAIISKHSGRALTVQGGRDNNGANIIQQGWRDARQQRWRLEQTGGDYYRIVSVDNGKCLDVTAQGKQDGADIQLWDYANQANQQWRLKR